MTLQLLAQTAQIAAPLIAAVAAMFSAISSRAAVRAARTARESQARTEIAESRERRARLQVEIESSPTPWPVVLVVTNEDVAHSARGLNLQLSDSEVHGEIIPGAHMRIETDITGPQLEEGDFSGVPESYRPENVLAIAPALQGQLDYLDDLELKRWRFEVRILETITQTPSGVEYSYDALLFGAPHLINDPSIKSLPMHERMTLAWQVLRGRSRDGAN